jgi:hypothetical protein
MNNKKKDKDKLSPKQFQMLRIAHMDTYTTDKWVHEMGMDVRTFQSTPLKLLQAQKQAHAITTHHGNLLTEDQRHTLEHFQKLMNNKKTRKHLKPDAANSVLNISSKVNRKLFKQHRQLQA